MLSRWGVVVFGAGFTRRAWVVGLALAGDEVWLGCWGNRTRPRGGLVRMAPVVKVLTVRSDLAVCLVSRLTTGAISHPAPRGGLVDTGTWALLTVRSDLAVCLVSRCPVSRWRERTRLRQVG